jgi:hypothetical protein
VPLKGIFDRCRATEVPGNRITLCIGILCLAGWKTPEGMLHAGTSRHACYRPIRDRYGRRIVLFKRIEIFT